MGYGFYVRDQIEADGVLRDRPLGYLVDATCDKRGCGEEIDRGLGYLCGVDPHGPFDGGPGCGRYYCGTHLGMIGPRGGCEHRGKRAWGRTLACMEANPDGSVVCLDRSGHGEPHAWAREEVA